MTKENTTVVLGEQKLSTFGLEEKKENQVFISDYNENEDKENVGLYSNMQTADQENVVPQQVNKLKSIQSIPINSKQRYTDMSRFNPFACYLNKKKRDSKKLPLSEMKDEQEESVFIFENPYVQ